jgi:hypothetical protein
MLGLVLPLHRQNRYLSCIDIDYLLRRYSGVIFLIRCIYVQTFAHGLNQVHSLSPRVTHVDDGSCPTLNKSQFRRILRVVGLLRFRGV